MNVLIRCRCPDYYDAADHAVIEVDENLILMLDKRLAQARILDEQDFYGTKWWDYTPTFIPCGGPDSVGLDMDEEEFEDALEAKGYVLLADDFKEANYAPMRPIMLTFGAASFYWTGTDKHIGSAGRVETHELHEDTIDEWAKMVGCAEMLQKVRSCRGVKA